ncbi:MAG: metallophosphoesterase [Planctomycetota bacterium]
MPVGLAQWTRREALAAGLGMGLAGVWPVRRAWAEPVVVGGAGRVGGVERWALLADTHINGDAAVQGRRGEDMTANLRRMVGEVLETRGGFRAAMINGDVSHIDGQPADYAVLGGVLRPMRAVMPVWLTLGNHDDRAEAVAWPLGGGGEAPVGASAAVVGKRVAVLPGRHADWVLLDSLDKVNVTPGLLGEDQLAWLERYLDEPAARDRPVFIMLHHTLAPPADSEEAQGRAWWLMDSDALMRLVRPRRRVKAVFHGHAHRWRHETVDGLHVVGQPPTSYLFREGDPLGWLEAEVRAGGVELKLRAAGHARDGELVRLKMR